MKQERGLAEALRHDRSMNPGHSSPHASISASGPKETCAVDEQPSSSRNRYEANGSKREQICRRIDERSDVDSGL